MSKNTKSCLVYLRASTSEEVQVNSIATQRAIIENFCKTHNYAIEDFYIEYVSGRNNERVEFNRCLTRAIKDDLYLISVRVDRLSRSLSIFERIENHLPRLRFCQLGDQTPSLLILSVLLSVAQQESINTGLRVKAVYQYLKGKEGSKPWGNPNIAENCSPLGSAVMKANALKFNTRIQGICDELKTLGYCTLQQLSDKLSELGIKTRRGSEFSPGTLHHVLNYGR